MKVWQNTAFRLQPSIKLHAPVTASMISYSGTNVLPPKDEGSDEGMKSPVQSTDNIVNYSGLVPGTSRSTVVSNHCATTTAASYYGSISILISIISLFGCLIKFIKMTQAHTFVNL